MKLFTMIALVAAFFFGSCPGPGPTPTPTSPSPTPVPHPVVKEKELLITDPLVVDSTEATSENGAFSIKTLLTNMAPQGKTAKDMMLSLMNKWKADQVVNPPFSAPKRDAVEEQVIKPWKEKDGVSGSTPDADWNMNFANAPFRLLAIVNRIDLRDNENNVVTNAGEGRFIFGVLGRNSAVLSFTIIFEYEQQATSSAELKKWAQDWHNLGTFTSFGPDYIAALKNVTDKFAGKGVMPAKPNGSALNQIRTNQLLGGPWELREFRINPADGLFVQAMTKQAPDDSLNNQQRLTDYINQNAALIKANRHEVPEFFPAGSNQPFLGGNSTEAIRGTSGGNGARWRTNAAVDPEARFRFSLNTCNSCHMSERDNDGVFFHVKPRAANTVAGLSRFMSEDYSLPDPLNNNTANSFNEMTDRIVILLCEAGEATCDQARSVRAVQSRANESIDRGTARENVEIRGLADFYEASY